MNVLEAHLSPNSTTQAMIDSVSKVLVVEDEYDIAKILEGFLKQNGYQVERAATGKAALELFRASSPDLVLLDIMLPELDGMEVLKRIRGESSTPVIMLSAKSEEIDKLLGLELGADDYITKPFRPREVLARVKAVLRRTQQTDVSVQTLRVEKLELDTLQTTIHYDGKSIDLTATEFRLIQHMAAYPGRTFDRLDLLEAALPESDALERVIDTHMRNIRRKLKDCGGEHILQTVRGMGYRLSA
ncbi:MAG: response regulator transcription factor [Deinococcota bacterium]